MDGVGRDPDGATFFFCFTTEPELVTHPAVLKFYWFFFAGASKRPFREMAKLRRVFAFSMLLGTGGAGALPGSLRAAAGARHTGGAWLRHSREHSRAPGMLVGALGLRGGCDEAAAAEPPAGFAAQLYVALKENKSLDPNDHPTSLQWVLAGEERTGCTTCGRAVPAPAPLHRH